MGSHCGWCLLLAAPSGKSGLCRVGAHPISHGQPTGIRWRFSTRIRPRRHREYSSYRSVPARNTALPRLRMQGEVIGNRRSHPMAVNWRFCATQAAFRPAHYVFFRLDRGGLAAGKPTPIPSNRLDLSDIEWSADGRSLICAALGGLVQIPVGGGSAEPLPFEDAADLSVARRSHRLVFVHAVQQTAIFRVPGPRSSDAIGKLIASSRYNGAPKYSPDGRRIVFMSDRTGTDELWLTDGEGQDARQLTSFGRATLGSPHWGPDSRRIAFDSTADGQANIYVVNAEGGLPRRITSGASSKVRPSWSHDGAWVYFGSNRTGAWEIWKSSPEGPASLQVTVGGGREAVEDPAGRFLYYTKAAPAPGIWRIPVSGGTAELVCDEGLQGAWAIGQRGLYYLDQRNELALREFSTGARIAIPTPGLRLGRSSGGLLGIAPDDRWILVTAVVGSESDLFMVENFH
jgi:hypothetical protein